MIFGYDPIRDSSAVASLWAKALGDTWPLSETTLQNVTANPVPGQRGEHFIALSGGQIVGFAATQVNTVGKNTTGCLLCIVVDPDYRRKGIGSALLEAALASMKVKGATKAMSGGKYPRIFPGVPDNLPSAQKFLEARGWAFTQVDYDLFRRLDDYQTPETVTKRIQEEGVQIYAGTLTDVEEVLAFNDREFAGWADTYKYVAKIGDYQDFLIARDPAKGVIGSLLMMGPGSNPVRCDALWRTIVGENIGGLGEVGIGKADRGRGLGLALVAVGSEILKARGVGHCNIGFTSLVDFYGRLGYQVWREYHIAWKPL